MTALSSGGVGSTAMAVAVDVKAPVSGTPTIQVVSPAEGTVWDMLAVPCLAAFFDTVCSWASQALEL